MADVKEIYDNMSEEERQRVAWVLGYRPAVNREVTIVKEGSEELAKRYDILHDKRKTWQCNRCGCIWKCEYKDNLFGKSHELNGDPDILCQSCGCSDTEEVKPKTMREREE